MRWLGLVVLVGLAAGCGDGVEACREAVRDLNAWQCDVCPGSPGWCPNGDDPPSDTELATCDRGGGETAIRIDCEIECLDEIVADGVNVCPPHPPPSSPGAWQPDWSACVEACRTR